MEHGTTQKQTESKIQNCFCSACGKDYKVPSALANHHTSILHRRNAFWENTIYKITGNLTLYDRCILYILILLEFSLPIDIINIIMHITMTNIDGWYAKEFSLLFTGLYELFSYHRKEKPGYQFNAEQQLPAEFIRNIRTENENVSENNNTFDELFPKLINIPDRKRLTKMIDSKRVIINGDLLTFQHIDQFHIMLDRAHTDKKDIEFILEDKVHIAKCIGHIFPTFSEKTRIIINNEIKTNINSENAPKSSEFSRKILDLNVTHINTTESDKKIQKITKKRREEVWDRWIGATIGVSNCMICEKVELKQGSCNGWDCGHVVPRCGGGKISVDNLRPICKGCNASMGKNNMLNYCKIYEPNSPVLASL